MGRELRQTEGKWAVHETVSEVEGPITPGFTTKAELVEHLTAHGTEWDQPWSQAAAERFVNTDGWAPSLIIDRNGVRNGYELPA